jgi:hypothetical protein
MDVHLETDYLTRMDMQASEEMQLTMGHYLMKALKK